MLHVQRWGDIRTTEMRQPFHCFTVAFVRGLRKPLSHTNRRWGGQTFLFWLSLLEQKYIPSHTPTLRRSELCVQHLVCSWFNIFRDDAARTVCSYLLSLYEQAKRPVVEEFRSFTTVKVHSTPLQRKVLHSERLVTLKKAIVRYYLQNLLILSVSSVSCDWFWDC